MTDERLAELERLEQAATPVPWDTGMLSMERVPSNSETDWHQLGADEKLAVAARNTLPELLQEVKRLRKVGIEMVNAIEQWANGEAGWSTRLRAAQEAARPVLGCSPVCKRAK